jgi:predicted  nucleic acid-binding Zn-ribbon protein
MPNRCTKCGKLHPDEAPYLIEKGCECGSRFFFFVKEETLRKFEKEIEKLSPYEIEEIQREIREILEKEDLENETVILDLEAIHVVRPGKYLIDLTNLFSQKPLIIKIGEGRYEIDLEGLIKKKKISQKY